MLTNDKMIEKMLADPEVKAEYDALKPGFALLDELLKARSHAGLSQRDVASRMGTVQAAVARIESGGGSKGHSPSVATLRRYAQAVGCELEIRLVRKNS